MRKVLSFISLFFCVSFVLAQTPTFQWAKTWDANFSLLGRSVAIDHWGNVYTMGYFSDTVDFDPNAGIYNLIAPADSTAMFLSKLDAAGNFVWAKKIGGSSNVGGYSIAVDPLGNLYTTGYFLDSVDFDPSASVFNLKSIGSASSTFILKLDSSGNFVWAKGISGKSSVTGFSIVVDQSANVYTTGHFIDTTDFNPGADTFNLTGGGAFILKLDEMGNFIWSKKLGNNDCSAYSMASDINNNIYTVGRFYTTADFDPSIAGTYYLADKGTFISKLDSGGNFIWAKNIGKGLGRASIAVDGFGDVYTSGGFSATTDFDPGVDSFKLSPVGVSDIFISKLDSAGNFIWAKQIGGTLDDVGVGLDVDAIGNAYATGYFHDVVDFDPGIGTHNLTAANADIFVLKLDAWGSFLWVKQLGDFDDDFGYSIKVDASDNVYTDGSFRYDVDFNLEGSHCLLSGSPSGSAFVYKVSQNTTSVKGDSHTNSAVVYPNPSDGTITIATTNANDKLVAITVYDILGRVVLQQPLTFSNNQSSLKINAPSGTYIVELKDNNGNLDRGRITIL